ncbi:hypothetical protein N7454_008210 [Penicillium verhagenii]|nr:hypothetical protein N7454_008210 [Penicillium verhagenii]
MIALSCVFDIPPDWDCLLSPGIRSHSILRNLVASAFFHGNRSILEKATVDTILNLYEAVSQLSQVNEVDAPYIGEVIGQLVSRAKQDGLLNPIPRKPAPLSTADRVNICCQLCSLIFWKLLEGRARLEVGSPATIVEETKLLLEVLTKVEPRYWIQNAPETLTWIVFTGIAGSLDEKDRGRLFEIGGTSLAAIDSDSLALVRQGWRYFVLLRRLAGLSSPSEMPIYLSYKEATWPLITF